MAGCIAVDLDGTLAEYHGWRDDGGIGPPVPAMLERVKMWVEEMRTGGPVVFIFTARVAGLYSSLEADKQNALQQVLIIQKWCKEHIGCVLPVTAVKTLDVITIWDDRAIQVEPNTGERIDGMKGLAWA